MWQILTPEILCQVFGHVITNTPLLTLEPHLFPWYLGHICSIWRDVFISSPEIWAYFVIDFQHNFMVPLERVQVSLEIVQLCLKRSKDCPIRFKFMHSQSTRPEFKLSLEILRTLVIHSGRWKDAYFSMEASSFSMLIEVKDKLPMLQSLCIFARPGSNLASAPFPDLFDNTPQLRHVSFHSYPLRKLDWSSLCTIHTTITEDTMEAPYFISHTSSKLEELFIEGTLPNDVLPLTFPSMKRLGIRFSASLEFLKTPALEELCIRGDDEISLDDSTLNRIAVRFIREQRIPLKKIAIYSSSINATTAIVQYLPDTIRHVYLHSWWKDIASALSSCPAARYIEYEYWSQYHYLLPMVALAESWREQSIVAGSKGIGPFENLKQFSIEFMTVFMGSQDKSFADFVDKLKKPFEECGVKCVVHPVLRRIHWQLIGVSPHFYFNCY